MLSRVLRQRRLTPLLLTSQKRKSGICSPVITYLSPTIRHSAPAKTAVTQCYCFSTNSEGKSQSNQETDTGEEPQAQGPRWFDYLVVLLGGTATAYFAARLLLLLLDWPEPCKVRTVFPYGEIVAKITSYLKSAGALRAGRK